MGYQPEIHKRRTIRLPTRDYAQANAYFVTMCVAGRLCLLGDIRNGEACLSSKGQIVAEEWTNLGRRFSAVSLDAWMIMPNHVHGIVWLHHLSPTDEGARQRAPTHSDPPEGITTKRKPLGQIIGAFKTAVMRRINELDGTPGQTIWQRNFHERVVRNEVELERIRTYIRENPRNWPQDSENPENQPSKPKV